MKPRALVLRTAGTNCDKETAFAFSEAGAECAFVHINELKNKTQRLSEYHILVLSGGFSYGDDIAAGKILANELKYALGNELKAFIKSGKLIIGICNGFQILAKAGLLPGNDTLEQEVTLTINDSAKFEDRWVFTGIIRDITERKKAEETLRQRIGELEQFKKAAIHRELRIKELKERLNKLEKALHA